MVRMASGTQQGDLSRGGDGGAGGGGRRHDVVVIHGVVELTRNSPRRNSGNYNNSTR